MAGEKPRGVLTYCGGKALAASMVAGVGVPGSEWLRATPLVQFCVVFLTDAFLRKAWTVLVLGQVELYIILTL